MKTNVGKAYPQFVMWRRPATSKKNMGKSECVLSTVYLPTGVQIDIRMKKNDGGSFTREGVRLTIEDATSLYKALGQTLKEMEREEDATSRSG
jgi:hypothetical protein|tara:strand:+ start:95 stop:373 length:279 start_codon:yes stop_codon:yes gene_type:complete